MERTAAQPQLQPAIDSEATPTSSETPIELAARTTGAAKETRDAEALARRTARFGSDGFGGVHPAPAAGNKRETQESGDADKALKHARRRTGEAPTAHNSGSTDRCITRAEQRADGSARSTTACRTRPAADEHAPPRGHASRPRPPTPHVRPSPPLGRWKASSDANVVEQSARTAALQTGTSPHTTSTPDGDEAQQTSSRLTKAGHRARDATAPDW